MGELKLQPLISWTWRKATHTISILFFSPPLQSSKSCWRGLNMIRMRTVRTSQTGRMERPTFQRSGTSKKPVATQFLTWRWTWSRWWAWRRSAKRPRPTRLGDATSWRRSSTRRSRASCLQNHTSKARIVIWLFCYINSSQIVISTFTDWDIDLSCFNTTNIGFK